MIPPIIDRWVSVAGRKGEMVSEGVLSLGKLDQRGWYETLGKSKLLVSRIVPARGKAGGW